MAERIPYKIVTDYEKFGYGFNVTVRPVPIGTTYDRHFRWLGEARDYAQRLAAATGWPVSDLCDDEAAA
jgi:hypothetical protein